MLYNYTHTQKNNLRFKWRQFFGNWQQGALTRAWGTADLSAASTNLCITLQVYIDTLMQTELKEAIPQKAEVHFPPGSLLA